VFLIESLVVDGPRWMGRLVVDEGGVGGVVVGTQITHGALRHAKGHVEESSLNWNLSRIGKIRHPTLLPAAPGASPGQWRSDSSE
jgi:hypothetical protein